MKAGFLPLTLLLATCLAADVLVADEAGSDDADAKEFRSLDQQTQSLKKEVLDLNRELFLLEEDLLFPANSQVAMYVSVDTGTFFDLESVTVEMNGKEVANYLYTEREAEALRRGGVHRIHVGNVKVGEHELIAFFSGRGPHGRDYRRGADLVFEKGIGAKYMELMISDREHKQQPEFVITEWE
ncbi:MAG: AraC family transcriptional regulator [Gammaproteobacteria bacterium]